MAVAVSAALHLNFFAHAGALWRDEVSSVNTATLPTWRELWAALVYESFPLTWWALLRGWASLPGGTGDTMLRVFGLAIGLSSLAALCWTSSRLRAGVPAMGLALVALSPLFLMYGDSLRAYGLGATLLILTFGAVYAFVDRPTALKTAGLFVLSLLTVHAVYVNAFLFFGVCCGAFAVAYRRRAWKAGVTVLSIGAVCAASLLIYLPIFRRIRGLWTPDAQAASWWTLASTGWGEFLGVLAEALGQPFPGAAVAWSVLVIAAVVSGIVALVRRKELGGGTLSGEPSDALLFSVVGTGVGIVGAVLFLKTTGLTPNPWYFIGVLGLIACGLDPMVRHALENKSAIVTSSLVLTIALLASAPRMWNASNTRMTSLDVIAEALAERAKKPDLIVLVPSFLAITFDRYYRGEAERITVPLCEDTHVNRVDLYMAAIASPRPVDPILNRITDTLARGGKVWLVRTISEAPPGFAPVVFPPAPHPVWGWSRIPYDLSFCSQLDHHVRSSAASITALEKPPIGRIHIYEEAMVQAASGWKARAGATQPAAGAGRGIED